jgi:hypothetical protein
MSSNSALPLLLNLSFATSVAGRLVNDLVSIVSFWRRHD